MSSKKGKPKGKRFNPPELYFFASDPKIKLKMQWIGEIKGELSKIELSLRKSGESLDKIHKHIDEKEHRDIYDDIAHWTPYYIENAVLRISTTLEKLSQLLRIMLNQEGIEVSLVSKCGCRTVIIGEKNCNIAKIIDFIKGIPNSNNPFYKKAIDLYKDKNIEILRSNRNQIMHRVNAIVRGIQTKHYKHLKHLEVDPMNGNTVKGFIMKKEGLKIYLDEMDKIQFKIIMANNSIVDLLEDTPY